MHHDAVRETVPSGEASFAELAKRVPSSAGYYLDQTGTLVIKVRDREAYDAARSAFDQTVASDQKYYARRGIRIEGADYSYGYLARQRDAVFEGIFGAEKGIVYLDLNEARNRVVIGVDRSSASEVSARIEQAILRLGLISNGN